MKILEREITREQAQLLFDVSGVDAPLYSLQLVPIQAGEKSRAKGGAFETEEEAMQWITHASQGVLKEAV